MEIKDYLNDLILKTKDYSRKSNSGTYSQISNKTNSVCSQIISENDKEISRIKEYYSQVIEALTMERDEKIQEIGELTTKNIEIVNRIEDTDTEEKVHNFEQELLKVISGVKETGIHIKELQKIRFDFDEVLIR